MLIMSPQDQKKTGKQNPSADTTPPRFLGSKAPMVEKEKNQTPRSFVDDITELRTLLFDGQAGLAFRRVKENSRLTHIAVAALSDENLAISGNAEWLVMQIASKGTKEMKDDLRGCLRAFFNSRWMEEQKAAGSWRAKDIKEELGKVLLDLEIC